MAVIVAATLAALTTLAAGAKPAKAADPTAYIVGSGNEFGTLDLTTGAFSEIGVLPISGNIFGMGFGPDGVLYGLDSAVPSASLYSIDTNTANVINLGPVGQSAVDATADEAGELFVLSQDVNAIYYTLNPPGTTANVVGPTGLQSQGLAAVTADGATLYTNALVAADTGELESIDTTTGAATPIGLLGDANLVNGLFLDGTLYGFDDVNDAIDTIDTTTGATTQIATYALPNGDFIDGSAPVPAPVPEPASFPLLAAALIALSILRRRLRSSPLSVPSLRAVQRARHTGFQPVQK